MDKNKCPKTSPNPRELYESFQIEYLLPQMENESD